MKQLGILGIIGGAALLIAAPFSLQWSQKNVSLSLNSAEARTATRIAGVSRRVHPRAYRCAVFGTGVLRPSSQSLQRGSGSIPPRIYLSTCGQQLLLTTFQFRVILQLPLACGRICLYRKKINISSVLAGQRLGIKEVDEGIWLVTFMHYDLGYFDLEQKTLQTLDNPFGTRLSPMS
jgi:hypothetical protein